MLITMKRQLFEALDDDRLVWECIRPAIMQARGKDSAAKLSVYSQLNKGQQALFVFRAYYNHAVESLDAFYWWSAHFFKQPTWSEIKSGLHYFSDDSMLELFEEIERIFEAGNQQGDAGRHDAAPCLLEDNPALYTDVSRLYSMFQALAPATLKRMGGYIRSNPEAFVQLED